MGASIKEQAFKQMFETFYTRLYFFALHIVGNEDDARDIVNDYFASLWEHFDHTRPVYSSTYLHKGVRCMCLDFLKHRKVKEKYVRYCMLASRAPLADEDLYEERMAKIDSVIGTMSERTRFVLDQCYIEGRKYVEVADMMGISRDGVRKHIIKALGMLRDAFSAAKKK